MNKPEFIASASTHFIQGILGDADYRARLKAEADRSRMPITKAAAKIAMSYAEALWAEMVRAEYAQGAGGGADAAGEELARRLS